MKLNFNQHMVNRTISNIIVVVAGISFFVFLQHLKEVSLFFNKVTDIITPFLLGFVIAYLLNNPVKILERHLEKFIKSANVRRGISVSIALVVCFLVISLLLTFMLPQLVDSVMMLVNNIQSYLTNLETLLATIGTEYHIDPRVLEKFTESWDNILKTGSELLVNAISQLIGVTSHVTGWLLNIFVAVIVSIYLLFSKERFFAQCHKFLVALSTEKTTKKVFKVGNLIHTTFSGFIIGKIIDSLIIGVIAFICLTIMKMPYVLLVSVIVGVTNVIPFFGPFIGAIPSTFIILIADPIKSIWFVIFIFILQQIDGNIIGPKILGDSTGLPTIWVLFAILVGGGLYGFIGMILGVPTFAVIYALLKERINGNLEKKGLPTSTEEYASAENPIRF